MPAPRAVLFDLDGLMFNTEELYQDVGAELLRRRGHAFTQELLDQMMGRPGRIALQCMIDRHGLDATVEQLQQLHSEWKEKISSILGNNQEKSESTSRDIQYTDYSKFQSGNKEKKHSQ